MWHSQLIGLFCSQPRQSGKLPLRQPPPCKFFIKKYYVQSKDSNFLFIHPALNSLVVDSVNEHGWLYTTHGTPYNKDQKCLDLFGHKSYSPERLQLRVVNHQVLLSTYDYLNYNKFNTLLDIYKWSTVSNSRTSLQASDTADTVAQSVSTVMVLWGASWLQLSRLPREVQSTAEDFPFWRSQFCLESTDDFLYTLNDLRATHWPLGSIWLK